MRKGHDDSSFFAHSVIFTTKLPSMSVLFTLLLVMSIVFGIVAVALAHYHEITSDLYGVLVTGVFTGIIAITLPAALTTIFIKAVRRRTAIKHMLFVSFLAAGIYSLFLIAGSAINSLSSIYGLASVIVIVGDASIFGFWFFVNKIVFGEMKGGIVTALIQPTLNLLTYIPASVFLFGVSNLSIQLLFIKLYAGIFIFLLITYGVLYIFDKPVEKSLGFPAMERLDTPKRNTLAGM